MYSYSTTGILETQFEPGDRIEVALDDDSRGLVLPAEFHAREASIESLEDPDGRPIEFRSRSVAGKLIVPDLAAVLPENWDCLWLEYRDQGRFRLVVEQAPRPPAEPEEFQTEQGVPILSDPSDWSLVRRESRRLGSRFGHASRSRIGPSRGPALDPWGLRSTDLPAPGPRDGTPGAPGPHGEDRAAKVSRPCPSLR